MRRTLLVVLVLFLTAMIAMAADATGAWKGSMDTPNGPMEIKMNLKAEGPALTGTVTVMEQDSKIENGKIDGDKVSFEVNPPQFSKVTYAGTLSGDELKLTIKFMETESPLVLKRVK